MTESVEHNTQGCNLL